MKRLATVATLLFAASPALAWLPRDLKKIEVPVFSASDAARVALAGIDLDESEWIPRARGGWTLRTIVSPDEMGALMNQHVAFQMDPHYRAYARFNYPGEPIADTLQPPYRTYAQMTTQLQAWATAVPSVLMLQNLGPTWETTQGLATRYVWGMRLASSSGIAGPHVLFDFNVHAREITTPEIALMFLDFIQQNTTTDPLVKWLLDTRQTWIVPMVNPDGHVEVETNNCWHRKNMNTSAPNSSGCPGVDLNRNYPYAWGSPTPPAGSNDPCSEVFFGTSAGSEPETQAMMTFVNSKNFVIWMNHHTWVEKFLWPWGYTSTPPPSGDQAVFVGMGARLVQFGNAPGTPNCGPYIHGQASTTLYATGGSTKDYAYGTKGAYGFTTEIDGGDTCDPLPSYNSILGSTGSYERIKPGLLWLMNIADAPATRSRAPMAVQSSLSISPNPSASATAVTVTCTFDNVPNAQGIQAAQYWIDVLGADGTGTPMTGSFGGTTVTASAVVPVTSLAQGQHTIYVRARGTSLWGSAAVQWFYVTSVPWTPTITSTITPTHTPVPDPMFDCTFAAYPNPSAGGQPVTFTCLQAGTLRLYTVSGELVRALDVSLPSGWSAATAVWDLKNRAGARVAPGLYLASVPSPARRRLVKLVVQ